MPASQSHAQAAPPQGYITAEAVRANARQLADQGELLVQHEHPAPNLWLICWSNRWWMLLQQHPRDARLWRIAAGLTVWSLVPAMPTEDGEAARRLERWKNKHGAIAWCTVTSEWVRLGVPLKGGRWLVKPEWWRPDARSRHVPAASLFFPEEVAP